MFVEQVRFMKKMSVNEQIVFSSQERDPIKEGAWPFADPSATGFRVPAAVRAIFVLGSTVAVYVAHLQGSLGREVRQCCRTNVVCCAMYKRYVTSMTSKSLEYRIRIKSHFCEEM